MFRECVLHRLILSIVLLLAVATPLRAQSAALPAAVRALLDATKAITVFDHVSASAADGVVTLEGAVTSRAKRDQIETEIATAPGVRQIVNRLRVLGSSPDDEDLRRRVARAIYGHPSFRAYAAMSQPPIRVLVDKGRVRLAGEVRTTVERLVARSIAETEAKRDVGDDLRVTGR